MQSSVRESKKPTRLKTLAGEFECQEVSVKSFRGDLKVFVSESAPLMKIVRLVLWNGSTLELVAHGKNAYSAFSKDLMILPMSKLTEMMGALQQGLENADNQAALPINGQSIDPNLPPAPQGQATTPAPASTMPAAPSAPAMPAPTNSQNNSPGK